jgi:tetratricopeptide (TPR) repeat protein
MDNAFQNFSALMKKRAFAEAVALAERQLVAVHDKSEFWLTQLSNGLRESGNAKDALVAAEKACMIAPNNPWALLCRAEALLKTGKPGDALVYFQEASSDAKASSRARRGILSCLLQMKQWDRLLVECSLNNLSVQMIRPFRIKALAGLKRIDEAIAECEAWLRENGDSPQALWQLTDLRIEQDGLDPVLLSMARLAKIPGKSPIYGEIYASLCSRKGNSSAALDQYQKLYQNNASPAILRKQAFALAKSGKEAKALPIIEELLRVSINDFYLHTAYIPACKRIGSLDRAHRFYSELFGLHPEEKSFYGRLKHVEKEMLSAQTKSAPVGPEHGREGPLS